MIYNVAVIKGDGIGPEVIDATLGLLGVIGKKFGHDFRLQELLMGGAAIDANGTPLPDATIQSCQAADAVLLGAVGGPKWDGLPGNQRPEAALLGLRSALKLYANIRPALLLEPLMAASPLRPDIVAKGIDMVVVRELTGGIYFGTRGRRGSGSEEEAFDTESYSRSEITRIAHIAFVMARSRRKKVTSIDKANVLESSRLWRAVVGEVASEYPDIALDHLLVDNAAMQLVKNPGQFDVIVTSNMFGDILSDEAAMVTGSIGILPSASRGDAALGLYEPIHGSAPDIAGTGKANPIATILSAAMMLRYSFQLYEEANLIEDAIRQVLTAGYRTADIMGAKAKPVDTRQMAELIGKICSQR